MHTLVSFATQWGSKYGGINCFNTDFLSAFGIAYHLSAQVVCIVASATPEEIEEARNAHVTLLPLLYTPYDKQFSQAHAQAGIDVLKNTEVSFDPSLTIWLGHDRITGAAAIAAAKQAGGRSALIHHMSYDRYESYAEDSVTAKTKVEEQKALFRQADIVLAVGPLLRDALTDLLGISKPVYMLIPGLAEIPIREAPKTFTAFLSGRLSDDAARIKQGHLGIAAFAQAHREACDNGMPDGLCNEPKLVLRGVDFEAQPTQPSIQPHITPETELKRFAEEYAKCVINLYTLPYTQDRQMLYADLSGSSVAMMPSWHEGFGLVAWEAIAAGVPLIISKKSGVYRLLEENHRGDGTGCVHPIDVRGSSIHPFFRLEDLQAVTSKLKEIAHKPGEARSNAGKLRGILENYTWPACAEQATQAFNWSLQKGSLSPVTPEQISSVLNVPITTTLQPITPSASPLQIPSRQWKADSGMADSQLLRAEEALVPFDPARQPDLDALNNWLDDTKWPQTVRLITGAGGLGKTRLALELCQQRIAADWHAGLLDALLEPRDMAPSWRALRELNKPLLIVIDYAETRQPVLLALINTILQHPGNHQVRLLLLARDGGEWWDNLPSKDPHCEALLSGYATTGPYPLSPLHNEENDRRYAYRQALHSFAQALGVSAPEVVPELTGDHFGRPLYLQMAALLALHGERPTTAEGLTKALLNHERRYWSRLLEHFAFSEPEHYAQQLLALTTLAGGFATSKDAQACWAKTSKTSLNPSDITTLFKALVPLYPGKQGLQAVRPDLLGEALVSQTLLHSEEANLLDAVLSSNTTQAIRRHALTVLARLSIQRPDLHETIADALSHHFAHCYQEILTVAIETPGHLPALAETAFARLQPGVKSQVAGLLEPQLRQESIQLAELGCLVTGYLMEKSHQKLQHNNNTECKVNYARYLSAYSLSLHRMGSDDQALDYAREAYNLFKQLYTFNSERFASDYSLALCNYANRLVDKGQNKDALDYSRQVLEIDKSLAKNNPDRYEHNLAISLNNYANCLGNAGENDDALEHARQSVEIYKRLAHNNQDNFEQQCAMSLNNLANYLNEAGQNEAALDYAHQALDIFKRLAQKNPDSIDPNYAMSLGNFANYLTEAGQNEVAQDYAYQALEIHKRLAQKNPERFDADYAMFLSNDAIRLIDVGQNEHAFKSAQHAYGIFNRLTQINPDRFAENMFNSNCLAVFISWLLKTTINSDNLMNLHAIPATVPFHRRQILKIYSAFIQACLTTELTIRHEFVKQVITAWNELSQANRREAQPYWLCVAAWSAKYTTDVVDKLDWKTKWHQYASQRQGRIPHWMREVAQRLEFQWPDE